MESNLNSNHLLPLIFILDDLPSIDFEFLLLVETKLNTKFTINNVEREECKSLLS